MKLSDFQGHPNQNTAQVKLTVGATAQTLAQLGLTLNAQTQIVLVQTEGGDVRWAAKTAPTATLGFLIREFNDPYPLSAAEAEAAQFISPTGSSVTLHVREYVQ